MQIGEFLKKFQKIVHDKEFSKKILCETLEKATGKTFTSENIKVYKGILYLQTDLYTKNAIFFKKKKILEQLNLVSSDRILDIK